MIIYSKFDASQFFPTPEECQERYMELDDYSIPDDADPTSQVNLVQPMLEGQRLYWEEWHKNNTKKEQIYNRKGYGKQERKERSKRAAERNSTTLECPHCGKTGNVGNMKRWHFDNCGEARKFNKDAKGRFT